MITNKFSPLLVIVAGFVTAFVLQASAMAPYSLPEESALPEDVIAIDSQEDFDNLRSLVASRVRRGGKDIRIVFKKGTYIYGNNHLYINGASYNGVSFHFIGNGSTIQSGGAAFEWSVAKGSFFNASYEYLDEFGEDYDIWSEMYQTDRMIEVVDRSRKICRVHCNKIRSIGTVNLKNAKILLTEWYTSEIYNVTRIEGEYVYFEANDLAKYKNDYNVNRDYLVSGVYPRFKLSNVTRELHPKKLFECQKSRFLFMDRVNLGTVEITGFDFNGCSTGNNLIHLKSVTVSSPIRIYGNTFRNMKNTIVAIAGTSDVKVYENIFRSNYVTCISSSNGSKNISVERNKFSNIGLRLRNTFCVVCRGENYYVADNEIKDFGYGAIGVGVWYKDTDSKSPCYGVVENNHIWFSPEYKKQKARYTLIDSGAIYAWTKNDSAIIRGNYIHDYTGMGSNRGIYCDDGAKNVKITGNLIMDIESSYSIDSWLSSSLERVNKQDKSNNTGNVISDNFLNGRYRIQGNRKVKDNNCVKGRNVYLSDGHTAFRESIVTNIPNQERDLMLPYIEKTGEGIIVSAGTFKQMEMVPGFNGIKKYLIVK